MGRRGKEPHGEEIKDEAERARRKGDSISFASFLLSFLSFFSFFLPFLSLRLLFPRTQSSGFFLPDLTQVMRELNQPEKPVTAIEPIPNSPLVAFALADGNVRLFDYLRFESRQTLRSGSSKPILKLVAYEYSKEGSGKRKLNEEGRRRALSFLPPFSFT